MLYHHETDDPVNHPGPETVSSDRPPQWKWSNCGYRCGLGCEAPDDDDGDGGGSDSGTARTLVGSDNGADPMVESQSEEPNDGQLIQEGRSLSPGDSNEGQMEALLLDNDSEDQRLGQLSLRQSQDDNGMSDSMAVGSCATHDHSSVASARGSVEVMSPGPGIGVWMDLPAIRFPPEYHFVQTPLRLSPQYEHCRGDPASHLVVQDRNYFSYRTEETWRRTRSGDGFALWTQS